MPNPPSDWRSAVAEQICQFVRDGRVLERFRAQCAAFLDEKKRDEEQLAAWGQRRKEHCERGLRTLGEFKARWEETERLGNDREAIERTRLAEDTDKTWVFDYYQDFLTPNDLVRLGSPTNGSMLIAFCVWVPPELSASASPKLTVPSLFGRFTGHLHSPAFGRSVEPGMASWAEKYASLAAIHDARFPDRDSILDLHDINCGLFTKGFRRRAPRERLRENVAALPDESESNIRAWLADVEADLAEHVGPPGQPTRTDGGRGDEGATPGAPQGGEPPACRGLEVDPAAKIVRWNGNRLAINSHADFAVLSKVYSACGAIVSYLELLRAVKPDDVSDKIQSMPTAPPEVKEAVSHINAALKQLDCPNSFDNVRGQGYRLLSSDE